MALHPDFPKSPYEILDPLQRWFPEDERLRGIATDKLLPPLVAQLRLRAKEFRDSGYVGATATSKALLCWWFETEHLQLQPDGAMTPFRYYFAQREALETIIWLVDVAGAKDKHDLMRFDTSGQVSGNMFDETWRRYVIKMATGSGKTKVMSLALAWSYFHKLYEDDSPLARNFLIIAPNIIVLDRLARDFDGLRIFYEDPILPDNSYEGRNWQDDFQLTLHRQDEVRATADVGNIFLTNIHRVYDSDSAPPSADDEDTTGYFLGDRPTGATTDSKVELDQVVRDIDELMVINDEAHHVHNKELSWFKSIEDIHNQLVQKGGKLSLQLDVTATPRHENGAIFVQTIADYPLVEAIAQNIVKHPVIPDEASQAKLSEEASDKFTEKYADFLHLGVIEWRKTYEEQIKNDKKSILFVMVDDTRNCDEAADYLRARYPDFENKDSVLTIHTRNNGEISEATSSRNKQELEKLRRLANEIDATSSPYKAIVSVLMLKEGWDVRNVTTIVGLRAYSSRSNILPEQTLGRGLRRMYPEQAGELEEYVSVIGTPAFMEFVEQIQNEGVELERRGMGSDTSPATPLVIEVDFNNAKKDIDKLDIELPNMTPRIYREYKNIDGIEVSSLLESPLSLKSFTEEQKREIIFDYTVVREDEPSYHHTTQLGTTEVVDYRSVIGYFARTIMNELRLVSGYDSLYAKIKDFVTNYLFGETVDLTDANVIRNLSEPEVTRVIVESFRRAINDLTVQDRGMTEIKDTIKLRDTRSFVVKNQPYTTPGKSIFNRTVGDSNFELQFSTFLDSCSDVVAHARNYLIIGFKLDYINAKGGISDYYPDFFVKTKDGQVTIVETKGLPDLDTAGKLNRLRQWCEDIAGTDFPAKFRFVYVDQTNFERNKDRLRTFAQIISIFTEYQ